MKPYRDPVPEDGVDVGIADQLGSPDQRRRSRAESARRDAEQKKIQAEKAEFDAKPLIEQNAIRLAELEREWAALGPVRRITFSAKFADENAARHFAADLRERDFEVFILGFDGLFSCSIEATMAMEPTAANVTGWEEWFQKRTLDYMPVPDDFEEETGHPSVEFCGWNYPKRVAPTFCLEGGTWSNTNAQERTEILFGETLGKDCVLNGKLTSLNDKKKSEVPFHIVPSEFLKNARYQRPDNPEITASGFAQWIYSLYSNQLGNSRDLERGIAAEKHIFAARQRAYVSTDPTLMRNRFPDWSLVHNGLNIDQHQAQKFFTIGTLRVGGEMLRALPDLIYRNRRTGEFIIVEIKHSSMPVPSNLWPNLWGQLWCYSQIEQIRKAPKVTVIGEIWGDAWTRGRYSKRLVSLRASVRRNPRAVPYNRFFRSLFNIYRGVE